MSKIGPSELDERLDDGDVFVLDIRPAAAYRREHVEGSHNAPVYDDLQRGDVEALDSHLTAVPDDTEIVTVCKAGIVARRATERLEQQGYSATTLTGGYTGWRHYDENTIVYRLVSALRRILP